MTSGMDLCRMANEQCFRVLFDRGYDLQYREHRPDPAEVGIKNPSTNIRVQVTDQGNVINRAEFVSKPSGYLFCNNVETNLEHQGQGIANAVFRFVEILTGRTLQNLWGGDENGQTDAGQRLWASRKRAFGHHRPPQAPLHPNDS